MKSDLTFSVGIPTYNQGTFLEKTILSLLNQTRPPDEIVISDHHSTDDTPNVIRKYANEVRCVKPPLGVNLTGQYNFTLMSQTCDWISLLSSDDIAKPKFCEVLLRGAKAQTDAVLVRSGWENIDAEGKSLGLNRFLRIPKVMYPPQNVKTQRDGPKVSFAAFAVKQSAFRAFGPIPKDFESLADWALFVQIAAAGTFIHENEIISEYRVGHDGNKFRERFSMWVRDEQRMFYDVIPVAAYRAGMTDLAWIDQASHLNLRRYIVAAYKEFAPHERSALVPLLQPWAERAGGQALLQSFLDNRPLPRTFAEHVERGKQLIRPFAQKLNAKFRRD